MDIAWTHWLSTLLDFFSELGGLVHEISFYKTEVPMTVDPMALVQLTY